MMYYQGDMSASIIPDFKTTHVYTGFDIGYRFNAILKLDVGYVHGKISGADSLVESHKERNLHFVSAIDDIRLLAYVDLFEVFNLIRHQKLLDQGYDRRFIGPNLILGMGYLHFNPKGLFEGQWHRLQELGTEGQNIKGGDYPEPYKRWQLGLKYGLGIGYKLSKQVHLEIEAIYHSVFTDYLDDLSGIFPDYVDLVTGENGELVSNFTYGGRDGSAIQKGTPRGNPDSKDAFVSFGLKITYVLSRRQMDLFRNL